MDQGHRIDVLERHVQMLNESMTVILELGKENAADISHLASAGNSNLEFQAAVMGVLDTHREQIATALESIKTLAEQL